MSSGSHMLDGAPSVFPNESRAALLNLFTLTTGMPVVLFERSDGQIATYRAGIESYPLKPYCDFVKSLPGGAERCRQDELARAERVLASPHGELTLCHAGLHSLAVPIIVDDVPQAAILFGKMQVDDDASWLAALARHEQFATEFALSDKQRADLRRILETATRARVEEIEGYRTSLTSVGQALFVLMDAENQMDHAVEELAHELFIRLQAVMAYAENLAVEMPHLKTKEAQSQAFDIVDSTAALTTVVQNLGAYFEEYKFVVEPLSPLVATAVRLYKLEAKMRWVDIRSQLRRVHGQEPRLTMSKAHLQLALNNLVHNAVKYSFRGSRTRYRYVKITGSDSGGHYLLAFENYGVGILPDEIESGAIFKDKYRGALTRGESRTGAGKGLYTVSRVIERHGGRIEVTSEPMEEGEQKWSIPHRNRFAVYLPY